METIGSVSGIRADLLRPDMILCVGEQPEELDRAIAGLGAERGRQSFRCYRAIAYDRTCVIWSGIGTGCVEPLLYELLRKAPAERRPRRIVLVGTAGALRHGVEFGRAYPIAQAIAANTALDDVDEVTPRWDGFDPASGKSAVSTDFFYGFSPKPAAGHYTGPTGDPAWAGRLATRFEALRARYDLVEMEVAQFYFLCRQFGDADLQYIAFKGASNPVTDLDAQTEGSFDVLQDAIRRAVELLSTNPPPASPL
ncbi:MAG TPA: hypothetical protein VEA69_25955 [Tepidisphaeraceae bacterium]|nr:hypothetical protein [Tepidisphaeraceae bacterium]